MVFANPEARSLLTNRHRRTPCVLLLDTSYSMEGEKIRRLNAGFRAFQQDILANPMAAQSVELCVIRFGPVEVRSAFSLLGEMGALSFQASGATPLASASSAVDIGRCCSPWNWRPPSRSSPCSRSASM